MLNAAVIGLGAVSEMHFKGIEATGNRIYAVCDIDKTRLGAAAEKYSAKAYSDYKTLLEDKEIDVVHICTPHYLHCEMAEAALRMGKHVFCEKPMTVNIEEAERLVLLEEETGKIFGVCFQNRYLASNKEAKRIIESGEYGAVKGIKGIVTWSRDEGYYKNSGWRGRWETEGGGVLINQAIHTLDLLGWFLGEITAVSGTTAQLSLSSVIDTEDSGMVALKNKNGVRGIMFATNSYAESSEVEIEIILEKAVLKIAVDLWVYDNNGNLIKTVKTERLEGEKGYWGVGHKSIIADFYGCIEENRSFSVNAKEGIKTIKMLESVYRGKNFDVI